VLGEQMAGAFEIQAIGAGQRELAIGYFDALQVPLQLVPGRGVGSANHHHAQLRREGGTHEFFGDQLHVIDLLSACSKRAPEQEDTAGHAEQEQQGQRQPVLLFIPAISPRGGQGTGQAQEQPHAPTRIRWSALEGSSQRITLPLQGVLNHFANVACDPVFRRAHQRQLADDALTWANGFHGGQNAGQRVAAGLSQRLPGERFQGHPGGMGQGELAHNGMLAWMQHERVGRGRNAMQFCLRVLRLELFTERDELSLRAGTQHKALFSAGPHQL
jgi:hypothetical protein